MSFAKITQISICLIGAFVAQSVLIQAATSTGFFAG